MIDATEHVRHAGEHESPRRMPPARVKAHVARITIKREDALGPAAQEQRDDRRGAHAKVRPRGLEHQVGRVVNDHAVRRHVKQHVEHHLPYRNIRAHRERQRLDGAQRAVVRRKGTIAGQRGTDRHHLWRTEGAIAHAHAHAVGYP